MLGDWFANIIFLNRRPVVLAMSERSQLTALIPYVEFKTRPLLSLSCKISEFLVRVNVPQDLIEQELREMEDFSICNTNNRSILGCMNDFSRLAKFHTTDNSEAIDLNTLEFELNKTPCAGFRYGLPSDKTSELFQHSLPSVG